MKAKLRIGNEMREGELFLRNIIDDFEWSFRARFMLDTVSFRDFDSKAQALSHFKSIGGIIIQDEKGS